MDRRPSTAAKPSERAIRRLITRLPLSAEFAVAIESGNLTEWHGLADLAAGTERFSSARMRQFKRGRLCAMRALEPMGINVGLLPIGRDRAPVWPNGVVGSITHSGDASIAIAAPIGEVSSIGIDLETSDRMSPGVIDQIAAEGELEDAADSGFDPALLLFSAKESLYKCLRGVVGQFVDFRDVMVHVEKDSGTFCISKSKVPAIHAMRCEVRGHFRTDSNRVITLAVRQSAINYLKLLDGARPPVAEQVI